MDIDNDKNQRGMLFSIIGVSILILMGAISIVAIILTKEDLRRTKFENSGIMPEEGPVENNSDIAKSDDTIEGTLPV